MQALRGRRPASRCGAHVHGRQRHLWQMEHSPPLSRDNSLFFTLPALKVVKSFYVVTEPKHRLVASVGLAGRLGRTDLDRSAASKASVLSRATAASASCFRLSGQSLSHRMYLLINFRKSTPLQNRQLNISISNSKQ